MQARAMKIRGDVAPFAGRGDSRVVVREGDVEYRVMPRGAGVELADDVGAQVEVDGLVQEDAEGERLVQVRSFRILDEFEEGGW